MRVSVYMREGEEWGAVKYTMPGMPKGKAKHAQTASVRLNLEKEKEAAATEALSPLFSECTRPLFSHSSRVERKRVYMWSRLHSHATHVERLLILAYEIHILL